jgi:hypothetical protein
MTAVDVAALSALYLRSETGFERSEFQLRLRQYRFWPLADLRNGAADVASSSEADIPICRSLVSK